MLRKRTRSLQKDQQMGQLTMSDSGSESHFQSDNMGSPTSPLDFRMFSNIRNPNKFPGSYHGGQQKSWDCSKVGLSIVDSLDDDGEGSGEVLRSSESKNILFGPRVRSKTPNFQSHTDSFQAPKSLPRNFAVFPRTLTKSPLQKGSSDVLFEIGEDPSDYDPFGKIRSCSLDSCRPFPSLSRLAGQNSKASSGNFCSNNITTRGDCPPQLFGGSSNSNNFSNTNLTYTPMSVSSVNGLIGSLSASEIELSEDYTCRRLIAPGCCSKIPSSFPSKDFLSFCYYCNKKLDEGKDIYIYRGEKAFCSLSCRSEEIMIDEELENTSTKSSECAPMSSEVDGLFAAGIVDAP
ncbi:FCS-LIKE ZINC FINGER 11 [Salix koriyanagi]|uniref:FCS-LIKE ZINC FINGER 11 n=1 Tax=Salix koriyanagi TaxID=2511006 RepID=A0A9Q0VB76_9ROSI|nr:FCS-LIKE ZINC FINGER 11 [Salix koriyanagi]